MIKLARVCCLLSRIFFDVSFFSAFELIATNLPPVPLAAGISLLAVLGGFSAFLAFKEEE